jgi:hypothetical protein
MVESDYKVAMRKAAKKPKVADAAAQKQQIRKVDDAAQMQQNPTTLEQQNDTTTSKPAEASDPNSGARKSPVYKVLNPVDHLSQKTQLVDTSAILQPQQVACEVSATADAVDPHVGTRQAPLPTKGHERQENTLSESNLSHNTALVDANTLLLLQQNARHTRAPDEGVNPIAGKGEGEGNQFKETYVDPGPESKEYEQTLLTCHQHGEPTMSSTDAKVDVLTNCVMAIQRQLDLLVQPNKQVQPIHVAIKTEHVKPEIVDVTLNTSDEGEQSDGDHADNVSNGAEKLKNNTDNDSDDDESVQSDTLETKRPRTKPSGKRVKAPQYAHRGTVLRG